MKPIPKLLSKTKLLRGYRCQKAIYLTINNPALEAPITPDTQALFDQGNQVGAEARKRFPGGTLIDNVAWDFSGALARTRELLAAGTEIIYEAAFEYMGCYARVDILQYSPATKKFNIYEVKSSTKVKPEHLEDVGLQTWIIAKSGLAIDKIHIMHLNNQCRYPDLSDLFTIQDVTAEMRVQYPLVKSKIHEIYNTLRSPDVPNTDIGPHCLSPNDCGFVQHCWKQKNIPEVSVFDLPNMRDRKWSLYQEGIISLDDPRLTDLNELQQRIVNTFKTGERFLDTAAIRQAISEWRYPFIFLDFETINPAIPRYQGCGPFMHVPFQFSVHRMESPDGSLTHTDYLHEDANDPRPQLIPALLEACGTEGAIIAYYGKFEIERIKELAQYASGHADVLHALTDRIVDPLPILRDHVYDNAFNGSFSLKKVAPALLGEAASYKSMTVSDGSAAQRAFEKLISTNISSEEKSKLSDAMRDYCIKDTQVMVDLVKWMMELK